MGRPLARPWTSLLLLCLPTPHLQRRPRLLTRAELLAWRVPPLLPRRLRLAFPTVLSPLPCPLRHTPTAPARLPRHMRHHHLLPGRPHHSLLSHCRLSLLTLYLPPATPDRPLRPAGRPLPPPYRPPPPPARPLPSPDQLLQLTHPLPLRPCRLLPSHQLGSPRRRCLSPAVAGRRWSPCVWVRAERG